MILFMMIYMVKKVTQLILEIIQIQILIVKMIIINIEKGIPKQTMMMKIISKKKIKLKKENIKIKHMMIIY